MENYKSYLRLRTILMAAWDPCGVAGYEGAYDEYDRYIPTIYGLVIGREVELLSDFLHHVETDCMGRTDWRKVPDSPESASYRLAASNIMNMYSNPDYPAQINTRMEPSTSQGERNSALNQVPFDLLEVLRNSVYYPASGMDETPMQLLGQRHDTFVYADYLQTRDKLDAAIQRGWFNGYEITERKMLESSEFVPAGFGATYPLWSSRHRSPDRYRPLEDQAHPLFAEWFIFERLPDTDPSHGPARIRLLFLCIEGCAGYQMLYNANGIAPAVLCVIRPGTGFGFNWDDFRKMDGWFAESVFRMGNPHVPDWMVTDQDAMADVFSDPIGASSDGNVKVVRRPDAPGWR